MPRRTHRPADPATHADPPPETRVIYRSLLLRGFAPAEAANLTAFLVGLPSPGVRWTLPQVEAIVALRDRRNASVGPDDRPTAPVTWSGS